MCFKILLLFLSFCIFGLFGRKKNYEQLNYMLSGQTRCEGQLVERKTTVHRWTLKSANEVCAQENCGSSLSANGGGMSYRSLIQILDCGEEPYCYYHSVDLTIKCSESVRLVQGPSLCSGTLQLHWNQSWTSVCAGGLDLLDAEVVCKELGCGAPSLLQGVLCEEGHVPLGQIFHCEGNETSLMNCSSSRSDNCSSGTAVQLTCSELVRLVGQHSRCAGTVQLRHVGEWRPVKSLPEWGQKKWIIDIWNHNMTAAVCRQLHCGSAISGRIQNDSSPTSVWQVPSSCVTEAASLRDCVVDNDPPAGHGVEVVCSDLLFKPNVSLSAEADEVFHSQPQGGSVLMGSDFSVRCSIEPQYPGGFFQLLSSSEDTAQSYILPAVNHSALFLFPNAGPAHKGGYTCVYHLHVFSHNFSSQSNTLHISLWENNHRILLLLLIPAGALTVVVVVVVLLCRKRKSKKAQERSRNSAANLGVAVYENVGLEQVPAESIYQSLCPETMDHVYGELCPPQQQQQDSM